MSDRIMKAFCLIAAGFALGSIYAMAACHFLKVVP